MSQPTDPIKVSLYGKPSTSYLALRSGVLSQSAVLPLPVELTEVSDTDRFIDESIKRIPACKVNDRWILPDEGDHAHYIGRVKHEISMEQQKSIFQHLLVPIDLSANAANALVYAACLAEDLGVSITVLHVMHPIQSATIDTPFNMAEQMSRREEDVLSFVADLAEQAPYLTDSDRVTIKTSMGLAASEILQYSLERAGTMIVMGTTGVDMFKKLFGSVSLSVINRAAVPVLMVPSECTYNSFQSIKYAGACEKVDKDVALVLSALVRWTQAQAEIVHVQVGNEDYSPKPLIASLCRNTGKVIETNTLKGQDVYTSLNNYCLKSESDLLVMARARGNALRGIFHRSATKAMSSRTHVPLLIIPQQ